LAEKVGVSDNTIRNMEARGDEPVDGFASTRNKVVEALKAMGIELVNGDAPGVIRFHKRRKAVADKSPGSARVRRNKTPQRKRQVARRRGALFVAHYVRVVARP